MRKLLTAVGFVGCGVLLLLFAWATSLDQSMLLLCAALSVLMLAVVRACVCATALCVALSVLMLAVVRACVNAPDLCVALSMLMLAVVRVCVCAPALCVALSVLVLHYYYYY